ncbi:MAG: helix-turn-helix transcriptional regulator [Spirochaetes bacterium]|nr:helix-turn-helix transcriptional regulator [Spirochaetota bacterium]
MYKSLVREQVREVPSRFNCRIQHLSWEEVSGGMKPEARGKRAHVPPHSHPFWQLEFVAQGAVRAEAGGKSYPLVAATALLIPPGVLHRFWYEEPHIFLSVKFTLVGGKLSEARLIEPGSLPGSLLAELGRLLDREGGIERVATLLPLADQLLGALVLAASLHEDPGPAQASQDPLDRIPDLIARRPELAASVSDLARELKRSPGHLSGLFKKRHGKALKAWLDGERAEAAASRLAWSDLSIAEISRRLGFPDPLTFSHFFRRVKGMGPRAWRKRAARPR